MGIIEIILTVFAWRNGWRWKSLIPMGIAFFTGIFAGIVVGASGGDPTRIGWITILDVFAIIALIIMVARKPESVKGTNETPKI